LAWIRARAGQRKEERIGRSSILNSEQKMILARIESALKEVTDTYWIDEQYMLTESDLVAKVFSLLDGRLGRFQIHCEIRPFKKQGNDIPQVIRKGQKKCKKDENFERNEKYEGDEKYDWRPSCPNTGTRIDLCVIDAGCKLWDEAKKKAKGGRKALRYWRLPSYPYEGIRAVIEFKVRVSGNDKRIDNDIEKLKLMLKDNNQCLGFLVVLDRCASDERLAGIRNRVEDTGIHFYGLRPHPDHTSP